MNHTAAPAERLAQLRAEFAAWRTHRIRGTRIPDELWSAATEVADALGAKRVAWVLRLDRATLQMRVARAARDDRLAPTFVEIAPATLGSAARVDPVAGAHGKTMVCAVEIADGHGRRLRVELTTAKNDWLAVARGLWDLAR